MIAFTGHGIDRADHIRSDSAKLAELRGGGAGLVLQLDGLSPVYGEDHTLQFAPLESDSGGELVFLGLRGEVPLYVAVPSAGDTRPAYEQRAQWALLGLLPPAELALYGGARSLADWHARHRFCAKCGALTVLAKGGWQRDCPACNAQHFPRTDPVAIMLVEHDGDLLLGRSARFPARSTRRWRGSWSRAKASRKRWRARCSRRRAYARIRCAMSPASRGRFRRN